MSGGFVAMTRARLRANRMSLLVMAVLMAVFATMQLQAYQTVFPNAATRKAALTPLVNNGALRALYGYPYDIADPTGWVAWRSMSNVAVVMAMWAVIVTTGALRGEEDAGRAEIVLSGPQPRRHWFAAGCTATVLEALAVGGTTVAALAAVGLPQRLLSTAACFELGLQVVLPALVFTAVAALTSQLVSTVRAARLLGTGILVAAFLIRIPADAGSGIGWLRWLTPLGWFEELKPPRAPDPGAVLAAGAATAILVLVALRLLAARDVGLGVLPARDSRAPRYVLIGAPWQAALRDEAPQLSIWAGATVLYAALLGGLVRTMLDFMRRTPSFGQFLGTSLAVDGFVAAVFTMIELIAAMLVVTLIVAGRTEEATGRLELILALPRSRIGWLSGRVVLAATAAMVLTALAALSIWVGAALTGQRIRIGGLLMATGNTAPIVVVTAGFTAVVLALWPRAVSFVYAVVVSAFLWDALGTALKAPNWSLEPSPFHDLARVPAQPFDIEPAAVITALGVALFTAALLSFRRRDLAMG